MFSEIEGRQLKVNLKDRGIKGILFDNDGVLSKTNVLYIEGINNFVSEVAKNSQGVEEEEIKKALRKEDTRLLGVMGVHPDRYAVAVNNLIKDYPQVPKPVFIRAWPCLVNIYNETPLLYPGVLEGLGLLVQADLQLVMVTNRWKPWHEMVMENQGLKGMFDHEEVVDCRRLKTKGDWQAGMDKRSLKPGQVLGVGDNIWGDIVPLYELGVPAENLGYIPSEWDAYSTGKLPAGVKSYNSFGDWIKSLAHEKR